MPPFALRTSIPGRRLALALAPVLALVLALAACGGDGGASPTDPAQNRRPVADAGLNRTVVADTLASVALSGSGSSDPDGDPLTYAWAFVSRPEGSQATLSAPTTVSPSFRADLSGDYVIELTVSDGRLDDRKTVTVSATCPAPISIAGNYETPQTYGVNIRNCTDYVVTNHVQFRAAATVQPGTRIAVEAGRRIQVTSTGYLSAVGTAASPILIFGSQPEAGWWASLAFTSPNPLNELTHVQISHGGVSSSNSNFISTMIFVGDGARLRLTRTTVRSSSGLGLHAGNSAVLSGFADNRFVGNGAAPLSVPARGVGYLDAATLYQDPAGASNAAPYIQVRPTDVDFDQTWVRTNVPLRLSGDTRTDRNARLTIAPGAILEFESGGYLRTVGCSTNTGGSINATGTAEAPIIFRGVSQGPGSWGGVDMCTNQPDNRLVHVQISGGGQTTYSGRRSANVYVPAGARIEIRNSTFRDSSGWGIWAHGSAILPAGAPDAAAAANTFAGNASGNVGS
jgi:hypothetical protein